MNEAAQKAKKDKLILIDWLVDHFPNTFFKKGHQVKPLKIGIFDDLVDFYKRLDNPPFSKKTLREALNYYSSSPAYLSCQKIDAPRLDLYGIEVDLVTAEQAHYAHQRFQERYARKNDKPANN